MNPQFITIELDPDSPGSSGMLSGVYFLPQPRRRIRLIELCVLWQTEGFGSADCIIHHFEQREAKPGGALFDSDEPRRFSVSLGGAPHSYDGALVKLQWLVRARMLEEDGAEWTGELPFRLGNVAPVANEVATE